MKRIPFFLLTLLILSVKINAANLVDMAKDTQWQMQSADGRIQLIWLMPTAYWDESFKSGGAANRERQRMINVLDKFIVIAVIDASVGVAGIPTGLDELAVSELLSLRTAEGSALEPIAIDKQEQELRALLNILKPAMSNMMGALGSQMQFLVYPGFDQKGKRVFDFDSDGLITLEYDKQVLTARTPLASTLAKKLDKDTTETFPGNFKFNPYTGKSLQ